MIYGIQQIFAFCWSFVDSHWIVWNEILTGKENSLNYRKIYEQHYNITLEKDMVIHHIDLDRSNNDISNLLMLPRSLHSKYHMCLNALRRSGDRTIISYDAKISGIVGNDNVYQMIMLERFVEALKECNKWHDIKSRMDYELEVKE